MARLFAEGARGKEQKGSEQSGCPWPTGVGQHQRCGERPGHGETRWGAVSLSGRMGWVQCTQPSRLWVGACHGGSTWKFFNDCFNFLSEMGNNRLFFTC